MQAEVTSHCKGQLAKGVSTAAKLQVTIGSHQRLAASVSPAPSNPTPGQRRELFFSEVYIYILGGGGLSRVSDQKAAQKPAPEAVLH